MMDHVQAAHMTLERRKAAAAGVEVGERGWYNVRALVGILAGTDVEPSEWEELNDHQARRLFPILMNIGPLHGLAGAHGEGFLLGHATGLEQRRRDDVDRRLSRAIGALRAVIALEPCAADGGDLERLVDRIRIVAGEALEQIDGS